MVTSTRAALTLGASALLLTACGSSNSSGAAVQRSTADLTAALLSAQDLGSGFSLTPADNSAGPTAAAGSSQACQTLASFIFGATTPGAVTYAKTDFTGPSGEQGGEEIDATGTQAKAEALTDKFKTAATDCPNLTASMSGQSVDFTVTAGPGQNGGAHDVGFTFAAHGTTLYGQVSVVGDILVESSLSDGGNAGDAAALNMKAVAKAKSTLGIK